MSGIEINLSLRSGRKVKRGTGQSDAPKKTERRISEGGASDSNSDLNSEEAAPSRIFEEKELKREAIPGEDSSSETGEESCDRTVIREKRTAETAIEGIHSNGPSANSILIMTEPVFNVANAIKLIPEFDGNPRLLQRFVQLADIQHSKASTEFEKNEFLDVIRSKLTDKAYNTLRNNTYSNWEELRKDLNKYFLKYRSTQVIQSDLFSVKQGPRESVSDYARKIEALLEELNISSTQNVSTEGITAIQNLNETVAINNFKRGLRAPLKLIVKSTKHSTLMDAIDYAVEEEQVSESDARGTEEKRCNYCKKPGHFISECRKRLSTQTNPNRVTFPKFPSTNRVNTYRNVIFCRYCKKTGHSIEECRKREFTNARRDPRALKSTTRNPSNSVNSVELQTGRRIDRPAAGNVPTPSTSGTMVRVRDLQ